MSSPPASNARNPHPDGAAPAVGRMAALRAWAAESPLRSALVGAAILCVVLGTVAAWLIAASLAITPEIVTPEMALEAFWSGENDRALELAESLRVREQEAEQLTGLPLYIRGSLLAGSASTEASPDRRKLRYKNATKQLAESLIYGLPPEIEADASFRLGESLLGAERFEESIEPFQRSLELGLADRVGPNLGMIEAMRSLPKPMYREMLAPLDAVLAEPESTEEQQAAASLLKAQTLNVLGQHAEAVAVIEGEKTPMLAAARSVALGLAKLRLAARLPEDRRGELLSQAEQAIAAGETLDVPETDATRGAIYLAGSLAELRGDRAGALQHYGRLRKEFGASAESVAAFTAEGELALRSDDPDSAIEAFLLALKALKDQPNYRSAIMTREQLRDRFLQAGFQLVRKDRYKDAVALVQQMGPVLDPVEQESLLAETLLAWGDSLVQASASASSGDENLLREGRARLRESGVSFERLAKAQYATKEYPEALWKAAGTYARGGSYTSALRVLEIYVREEPTRRAAEALLRIGEAELALRRTDDAILSLSECAEFYPNDPASYRARLECARAHRIRTENDRAEELLRENLLGSPLSPSSPEWRESLLELGRLLYETQRYDEAVDRLEEYVLRYPGSADTLSAQYMAAEAYRLSAGSVESPESPTGRQVVQSRLVAALGLYAAVQREITISGDTDPVLRSMMRNCYMMQGSVLFDLGRYKQAIDMYSNVSTVYQNEPIVLETLVEISLCWRRLNETMRARLAIKQAQELLGQLAQNEDFASTTNLSADEWRSLLDEMRRW